MSDLISRPTKPELEIDHQWNVVVHNGHILQTLRCITRIRWCLLSWVTGGSSTLSWGRGNPIPHFLHFSPPCLPFPLSHSPLGMWNRSRSPPESTFWPGVGVLAHILTMGLQKIGFQDQRSKVKVIVRLRKFDASDDISVLDGMILIKLARNVHYVSVNFCKPTAAFMMCMCVAVGLVKGGGSPSPGSWLCILSSVGWLVTS